MWESWHDLTLLKFSNFTSTKPGEKYVISFYFVFLQVFYLPVLHNSVTNLTFENFISPFMLTRYD